MSLGWAFSNAVIMGSQIDSNSFVFSMAIIFLSYETGDFALPSARRCLVERTAGKKGTVTVLSLYHTMHWQLCPNMCGSLLRTRLREPGLVSEAEGYISKQQS